MPYIAIPERFKFARGDVYNDRRTKPLFSLECRIARVKKQRTHVLERSTKKRFAVIDLVMVVYEVIFLMVKWSVFQTKIYGHLLAIRVIHPKYDLISKKNLNCSDWIESGALVCCRLYC